jgi:hypothetical protein
MAEILVCVVGCTLSRFFYHTRDSEANTASAIRQVSTNKQLDDTGVFVKKVEVLANRHFARRHHRYLHSAVRAMESIWARLVELEEMFWPEDGHWRGRF